MKISPLSFTALSIVAGFAALVSITACNPKDIVASGTSSGASQNAIIEKGIQTGTNTPDALTFEPLFTLHADHSGFESEQENQNPPAPFSPIEKVRIQVFPHMGKYTSPQGKDTHVDAFTLSSQQPCTVRTLTGRDPDSSAPIIKSSKKISFTKNAFSYPVSVHCTDAATLTRESGLKAFQYSGEYIVRWVQKTADFEEHLKVINVVDFETYIKGVIPSLSTSFILAPDSNNNLHMLYVILDGLFIHIIIKGV